MDPGNWATDIAGGSAFGYKLIWVLFVSNLIALLLQSLSARLGIVRGLDLAQASKNTYPALCKFLPLYTGANSHHSLRPGRDHRHGHRFATAVSSAADLGRIAYYNRYRPDAVPDEPGHAQTGGIYHVDDIYHRAFLFDRNVYCKAGCSGYCQRFYTEQSI